MQLCWTLSHLLSPPNQIPNPVSIYQPCSHTCLTRCPRAYAMQMPLHVKSCHMHNECDMDNTIHTTYRCHGQSHHLHMTSIHHFIHVNISCKHISTFTFNMSFYDQAMTHTQASDVMVIAYSNLSHVNILEHKH